MPKKLMKKASFVALLATIVSLCAFSICSFKVERSFAEQVPSAWQGVFTDYTLTSLNESYDTMEEVEAFLSAHSEANNNTFFRERALGIIKGEVLYNAKREFTTKSGENVNHIDQFGDIASYSAAQMKWEFTTWDEQPTGLYLLSGGEAKVFVEATNANAKLPSIVLFEYHGYYGDAKEGRDGSYYKSVSLGLGLNTINSFNKNMLMYIRNPYTRDEQGDVSLYIEGGSFYPIFEDGEDENEFIAELIDYHNRREADDKLLDVADLVPKHAYISTTFTSLYEAYVEGTVSPEENLGLWSDYFEAILEANGLATSENSPNAQYHYDEKLAKTRISLRYMTLPGGVAAYAWFHHVGFTSQEELKWVANYSGDFPIKNYFNVAHEIGHVIDNEMRFLPETTNNMSALFSCYRLTNSCANINYFPYDRVKKHLFSDYTLDTSRSGGCFVDGNIIYPKDTGAYDCNYLVWWILESVFPGYWAHLSNIYCFDHGNRAQVLASNQAENMVYVSSLATGYDLTDYFDRWGFFLGEGKVANNQVYTAQNEFHKNSTSQTFQTLMKEAKEKGEIKDNAPHFWYADNKQMNFMLAHKDETDRNYKGTAKITSVTPSGNSHKVTLEPSTDNNFLGYEILSSTDNKNWKIAGFTYSNTFTDDHNYGSNVPSYKAIGYNRFFSVSGESNVVSSDETAKATCKFKVNGKEFSDFSAAYAEAKTNSNATIYLCDDCTISEQTFNLTLEVDQSVKHDLTISASKTSYIFFSNGSISLKGRKDAHIVLDNGNASLSNALVLGGENMNFEYVDFKNATSNNAGGIVSLIKESNLTCTNCTFENLTGKFAGAVNCNDGKNATIKFENCTFKDIHSSGNSTYYGAIGLGYGKNEFVNCTFEGNDEADFCWHGSIKFTNAIPTATIELDGENNGTIELEDIKDGDKNDLTFIGEDKYVVKENSTSLTVSRPNFTLTFNNGTSSDTYTVNGTTFIFGSESVDFLNQNQYLYEYSSGDKTYHNGDRITLDGDMTFTVTVKDKYKLSLCGKDKKSEVLLRQGEFYCLPLNDGGEVIKWTDGENDFWAGDAISVEADTTLFAVYVGYFYYRVIGGKEVTEYGYKKYGETLDVAEFKEGGKLLYAENSVVGDSIKIVGNTDILVLSADTKYDLSSAQVELDGNEFTYNGSEIRPKVTVKIGGDVLPKALYSVTYSDNINAGTATVTVNSNLEIVLGSATKQFTIKSVSLGDNDVSVDGIANAVYSGKEIKLAPTITWNGKTLSSDVDYTLDYSGDLINLGAVTLTIRFKGNFSGVVTRQYHIVNATLQKVDDITVDYEVDNVGLVNLPDGWSFVSPDEVLVVGENKVVIVYKDTDNYANCEQTITITRKAEDITTDPTDPDNPSKPDKPNEPSKPDDKDPDSPTDPDNPTDPDKPSDPSKPDDKDPDKPTDPSEQNPSGSGKDDDPNKDNPSDPSDKDPNEKSSCSSCGTIGFGGYGGLGGGLVILAVSIAMLFIVLSYKKASKQRK